MIGTIITGLVLLAVVTAIVVKLVRGKKNGQCAGCSCGEAGCPASSVCYIKK